MTDLEQIIVKDSLVFKVFSYKFLMLYLTATVTLGTLYTKSYVVAESHDMTY
jgi:hypothetical protein